MSVMSFHVVLCQTMVQRFDMDSMSKAEGCFLSTLDTESHVNMNKMANSKFDMELRVKDFHVTHVK